MTLQQLRTFCAVVENASFHRAAERLYMAQPSVSQQIAALERYYGVTLFHRSGRSCKVSPEGQALYRWVKEALAQLDDIPPKLEEMGQRFEGTLTIGASTLTGNYLLPPIIKLYQETYPRVRLTLQIGHGNEMVERVRAGSIHFAIVGNNLNWKADPDFVYRRIATDRLALIVWPGHPWCGKALLQPAELMDGVVFIHSRQGSAMRSMVERYFDHEGIAVAAAIDMGNHETIKHAVEEKIGVSLISRVAVQRELASGRLVEVPLARLDKVSRSFLLVSSASTEDSYIGKAFIDLVTSTLQEA